MNKINELSLPVVILIATIILGSFYYASQLSKQKSIEKQQQIELQAKKESEIMKTEQAQIDLIKKNKQEEQKSIEENLVKQQKEKSENFVNKCITDAHTELKTLQSNFDWIRNSQCLQDSTKCNFEFWDKAKNDAFTTYKEEWIPQCKLGNRVFLDYDLYKD